MIKKQLIETIRGYVLKREPLSDDYQNLHPARIELAINQIFGEFLFKLYGKNNYELDNYAKTYYDLELKKIGDTRFLQIPVKVLHIPNNRGVMAVRDSNGNDLIPSNSRQNSYLKNAYFKKAFNKATFRQGNVSGVTEDVIIIDYFGDKYKSSLLFESDIIRPFEAYDDTEDVYMPKGEETKFIASLMEIFNLNVVK